MAGINEIKFDEKGLVPVVTQDVHSGTVLMQAYMNQAALEQTLETGWATYYSRSRQELWVKGESSGNKQKVSRISYDCDGDSILLQVEQTGVACHTGSYSCFYRDLKEFEPTKKSNPEILFELYGVVQDRMKNPKEGSYTNYLLEKGVDKVSKKVVEEACEVIIEAKNQNLDDMQYEVADLLYHLIVLMAQSGLSWERVFEELQNRR